jgi:hypothetical protein
MQGGGMGLVQLERCGDYKMNRNEVDAKEFQISITKELNIVKNRVRNLIGDSHWGEDGRYKEAVLQNVIRRFLPVNRSLGTGFIIKKSNNKFKISNQIDIIIWDNTIPILFSEGDFVITTSKNVKGIIEVKTKIRSHELRNIIKKAKNNGKLVGKEIFSGIFSYEFNDDINSSTVSSALKEAEGYVNHLSLGEDIFIKFWDRGTQLVRPVDCSSSFYNIYRLRSLSFSYFLSNLLDNICHDKLDDRLWFLFPIEGTKEVDRERTICLD